MFVGWSRCWSVPGFTAKPLQDKVWSTEQKNDSNPKSRIVCFTRLLTALNLECLFFLGRSEAQAGLVETEGLKIGTLDASYSSYFFHKGKNNNPYRLDMYL